MNLKMIKSILTIVGGIITISAGLIGDALMDSKIDERIDKRESKKEESKAE